MKGVRASCAFALLAAAAALPARAAVVVNDTIDLHMVWYVSCANGGAGEYVSLAGPLHVLISYTVNGNRVSGKSHYQPQGVAGIGQTTGDTYRGVGVTESHFSGSFQNGQYTNTYVNNFRIIGQGPGNNFMVHENSHITIRPDGDVSTYHDNFSVDCR